MSKKNEAQTHSFVVLYDPRMTGLAERLDAQELKLCWSINHVRVLAIVRWQVALLWNNSLLLTTNPIELPGQPQTRVHPNLLNKIKLTTNIRTIYHRVREKL